MFPSNVGGQFCKVVRFDTEGGGSGGSGNGSEEGSSGEKGTEETVSKSDHDLIVSERDKLKQDLEDARMEVITPEYIEFLNSKGSNKGDDKGKLDDKSKDGKKPDLTKLTSEEIQALVDKQVETKVNSRFEDFDKKRTDESKAATQLEIEKFAKSHSDYEHYRPTMYGISLDPKHNGSSLQELYDAAKDQIKRIHTGPTDKQKKSSQRSSGERPAGSSGTVNKSSKGLSKEEAADQAWDEVVGETGLPTE